jgi:ATP-binding cassette subfamily C (CFTR/MRP) protein 4
MNLQYLRSASGGQVVNLLSNDVSRFDMVLGHIHFMWVAPIQLALVIYILWGYFGPIGLIGVGLLVLFAPLQGN